MRKVLLLPLLFPAYLYVIDEAQKRINDVEKLFMPGIGFTTRAWKRGAFLSTCLLSDRKTGNHSIG